MHAQQLGLISSMLSARASEKRGKIILLHSYIKDVQFCMVAREGDMYIAVTYRVEAHAEAGNSVVANVKCRSTIYLHTWVAFESNCISALDVLTHVTLVNYNSAGR